MVCKSSQNNTNLRTYSYRRRDGHFLGR